MSGKYVINPATRDIVAALPVSTSLRTDEGGWTSMLIHECESPPLMETPFETRATPDAAIKLLLASSNRWMIKAAHGWQRHDVMKGSLCFTRPDETHRLRWKQSDGEALGMMHVYIPESTLLGVADEMKIATGRNRTAVNTVFFDDRTVSNLIIASAQAARGGASDAYAQSAAILIAFHLQSGNAGFDHTRRSHGQISDQRLLRVLDLIETNYDQPLSLEALASEAGLSRYHFAMVFRRAVGSSPHQHVREVRLRCARAMLRSTDRTVLDIALSCGFANASHFAAAFRTDCGESPSSYRARHREA